MSRKHAPVQPPEGKRAPPGALHTPVYRDRTAHEQHLQADHPALLLGCVCGEAIDARGKPPIADAHLRATLYAKHLDECVTLDLLEAAEAGDDAYLVEQLAASAPLVLRDEVDDEVVGDVDDDEEGDAGDDA